MLNAESPMIIAKLKIIIDMKRISLFMLALMACTLTFAENVKLNGLYFSLGTTTAQLIADQSSDKSVYKAYTEVTIPASVTYNAYTYPVTSIGTICNFQTPYFPRFRKYKRERDI